MTTPASRILDLFIQNLNGADNEESPFQTCFTCIAIEDYFPYDEDVDQVVMQAYAKFLNIELVDIEGTPRTLLGNVMTLEDIVPEASKKQFQFDGKIIFDTRLKTEVKNSFYWQTQSVREEVYLRFGVLNAMRDFPFEMDETPTLEQEGN